MKRNKRNFLPLLILMLIVGILWFYWGHSFPLEKALPEEKWVRMQMWVRDDTTDEWIWEIEPPALESVLVAIENTTVDRNDKDKNLGYTGFEVLLYPESGDYPTLIYVNDYGKIAVAVAYDLDNYQYFEHGEELFDALSALVEGQPKKNADQGYLKSRT